MLDFQKSVIIIYFWVINVNQFYNLIKYLNINRSQYWHLLWDCKRKGGQNKTYTVIQNVLVNEGSDKKLKWKDRVVCGARANHHHLHCFPFFKIQLHRYYSVESKSFNNSYLKRWVIETSFRDNYFEWHVLMAFEENKEYFSVQVWVTKPSDLHQNPNQQITKE